MILALAILKNDAATARWSTGARVNACTVCAACVFCARVIIVAGCVRGAACSHVPAVRPLVHDGAVRSDSPDVVIRAAPDAIERI